MKNKNYRVSRATLYNTIEILMECALVRKHQFGQNQAHYEKSYFDKQHDHVIMTDTGEVIEFCDPRIQSIKKTIEEVFDISISNQNFSKLAEDLVFEHSKKWAMNRYKRGSISNATVTKKDNLNRPVEMTARYRFTGWSGDKTGSVRITFTEGLPECLYFFDFPTTCRSADRRLDSQFANGAYNK